MLAYFKVLVNLESILLFRLEYEKKISQNVTSCCYRSCYQCYTVIVQYCCITKKLVWNIAWNYVTCCKIFYILHITAPNTDVFFKKTYTNIMLPHQGYFIFDMEKKLIAKQNVENTDAGSPGTHSKYIISKN